MNTKYNVDYFIKKFNAIPSKNWGTKQYKKGNRFCAMGHCGVFSDGWRPVYNDEALELSTLFMTHIGTTVQYVNDNRNKNYRQSKIKDRVLSALYDIKELI